MQIKVEWVFRKHFKKNCCFGYGTSYYFTNQIKILREKNISFIHFKFQVMFNIWLDLFLNALNFHTLNFLNHRTRCFEIEYFSDLLIKKHQKKHIFEYPRKKENLKHYEYGNIKCLTQQSDSIKHSCNECLWTSFMQIV